MIALYILREGGQLKNELQIERRFGSGFHRVRLLLGDEVVASASGLERPYEVTFNLPLDTDGNPIQGDYTIEEHEEVWGSTPYEKVFSYTYDYVQLSLDVRVDGLASTLEVEDITDYSDFGMHYMYDTKVMTVTPPAGSGLSVKTGEDTVSYDPNIWSGEWGIDFTVTVGASLGWAVFKDEVSIHIDELVRPNLTEAGMYDGVRSLLTTYEGYLESAPKKAQDLLPVKVRVLSLVEEFSYRLRSGDTGRAYDNLKTIYDILSPTYLGLSSSVEEITPWSITGLDHTHTNYDTISRFTASGGNLYWDGTLLPLTTEPETGRVRMDAGDTLDWLASKVDNTSIEVYDRELRIKDSFISGLADGTTITYTAGQFSAAIPSPSEGTGVIPWEAGTYASGRMVFRTVSGEDTFYVATTETSQQPPHSDWRLATDSDLRHNQNTDVKLGNIALAVSTISGNTLSGWENYNLLRVSADGVVTHFTEPSGAHSDVSLPTQDVTVQFVGSGTLTLTGGEAPGTGTIPLNNRGATVALSPNGWARYRYNIESGAMDLVAASTISEGDLNILGYEDFDAAFLDDAGDVFRYHEGTYTLNTNLSKYDNTTTQYQDDTQVLEAINVAIGSIEHDTLTDIQGAGTRHISQEQNDAWDAKQEAITFDTDDFTYDALTHDLSLTFSLNDAVEGAHVVWSADKILSLFEGDEMESSQTYRITLQSGTGLSEKLGGQTKPDGWVLSAVGGTSTTLKIAHGLGREPAKVTVYSSQAGVKTELRGTSAYGDMSSKDSDNSIELSSYVNQETATVILIVF